MGLVAIPGFLYGYSMAFGNDVGYGLMVARRSSSDSLESP